MMDVRQAVSRRSFMGGLAAVAGLLGLSPERLLAGGWQVQDRAARQASMDTYDAFAKLANNENNWGPPESVLQAMANAMKYSNRYGYPDGGIVDAIAAHHGVKRENILLGAGSSEILKVVALTFLEGQKKVIGVEPSYATVFEVASGVKAESIQLALDGEYRQPITKMVAAAKANYRDVGFIYLCNPNNPTGVVVSKREVQELLDGIPADVPVLIDEAYHHYVEDPAYATSVPYVLEGRRVIIARTFSKIVALAGMRLGYAVAPADLIQRMRPHSIASINAPVKWGAVAALEDTAAQEVAKRNTIALREKTSRELEALGYDVIPSQTNFFMVAIHRQVQPVIQEFRERGVQVGRPFPPMLEHLRVSVGTEPEMEKFLVAFKDIFPPRTTSRQ
ncbi:MAG: histidinol-phosphate transaminase [Vicinamibacterales bacterium]